MSRLVCLSIVLGACSGGSSSTPDAEEIVNCATVTGADTYIVGLHKPGVGGTLDFKLMSATPAPPAQGNNDWTLQINAMSAGVVGAPVAGAQIQVTPYMPAHMHTSPIKAIVTDKGNGLYELTPVNLWMPGVWQTTISVASASGTDNATYSFCIPN